jgi:hypothetical protein
MAWYHKAHELYKRCGAPAKFAAKLILGTVVPGSGEVIELIDKALDCAHETVRDNLDASPADLERLEEMLDVLLGDLQPLMAKLARLEQLPDLARERLDLALATDDVCRRSARTLEQCVGAFDRLGKQQEQMLAGQEFTRPSQAPSRFPAIRVTTFTPRPCKASCVKPGWRRNHERIHRDLRMGQA